MKAFKTLSILLFIAIAVSVFGQVNTKTENPFIEVVGIAKNEIVPNEIYITIDIHERVKEKITIEKQEEELKKALTSINIPLENLSLSYANSNYVDISWSKRDIITKTEYILKVEDALAVGQVFEKLDGLKIVDAHIIRVDHSEIESLQREVRISAIKAAKEKADYLLASIGEKTGKPQIIREENMGTYSSISHGYQSKMVANQINATPVKGAGRETQFKKIILQSSIYVKFEIE